METVDNHAGNIIVNLSSLPDFLRKPILKKRMSEFFSLPEDEKKEIVINALDAGPTIPFQNFSRLFKTWLEMLVVLPSDQRDELCRAYVAEIIKSPQKLISFNLDGILEIFLLLNREERNTIAQTVRKIASHLSKDEKRIMAIIIPDNAKAHIGI